MDRMLALERYLDDLDLSRLEQERALTLEGWLEPRLDLWARLLDDDEA